MESSRIFVRNLPPNITEDEFKNHFSKFNAPTDTRFFGPRRIGYVGYKTPEDAAKAVKYFNKSFIRMSRIVVEIARPATENILSERRKYQSRPRTSTEPANDAEHVKEQKSRKRKREPVTEHTDVDPKLKEFLGVMQKPSKAKAWMDSVGTDANAVPVSKRGRQQENTGAADSDEEYQSINGRPKMERNQKDTRLAQVEAQLLEDGRATAVEQPDHAKHMGAAVWDAAGSSEMVPDNADLRPKALLQVGDGDWLRSRISKTLDFMEEDRVDDGAQVRSPQQDQLSEDQKQDNADKPVKGAANPDPVPASVIETTVTQLHEEDSIRESRRLFLRNLPYTSNEDDIKKQFASFGDLVEVHIPMDTNTGQAKGFAYVEFADGDCAVEAFKRMDSQIFQGRILHILPAESKRVQRLDEYAISKLPLKVQKQIQRRAQASTSTFNWNSLYMSTDSVLSSMAARLGVHKSEVLDPTASDAAVKQAFAETHVIQETKQFFAKHGVDLEAFKSKSRGDTAILLKNFPFGTKVDELRKLFEDFGKVTRFLMPPAGTIAIVELASATEARTAFKALAYRKIKDSIIFLEWAPRDIFKEQPPTVEQPTISVKSANPTAADLLEEDAGTTALTTTTLFVRNLNFATTSERLKDTFSPLAGFLSARVKTKPDPKKPGQVLSMGFGFIEFRTRIDAQNALAAMNGHVLDGYKLDLRASQRALDAAEERRKEDRAKALAGRRSKIIIKNLPFEASKKEVRALFAAYGQLRSLRLPKKFDHRSRGFAFAEYASAREAANAMDALRNTHLLGRRLVLEYAEEEPEDAEAEIERMQQKVGRQTDKVTMQKLTGSGRKKFNVDVLGTEEQVS